MTWYWFLLIIFGYLIVGAIIAGLGIRLSNKNKTIFTFTNNDDDDDSDIVGPVLFTITLWPFVLIFAVLALIVDLIASGGKNHDENRKKETKEGLKDI